MSKHGRTIALLGIVAGGGLLQACATTKPPVYGPIDEKQAYGYRDHQNPDGGHTVVIVMPAASMPAAREWFDRRAAELCPGGIDRTNVFSARLNESNTGFYGTQPSAATRIFTSSELQGYVYCKAGTGAAG